MGKQSKFEISCEISTSLARSKYFLFCFRVGKEDSLATTRLVGETPSFAPRSDIIQNWQRRKMMACSGFAGRMSLFITKIFTSRGTPHFLHIVRPHMLFGPRTKVRTTTLSIVGKILSTS